MRFLTDRASLHDYASVIRAMPKVPFVKAAITTTWQSLSRRSATSGWKSRRRSSAAGFERPFPAHTNRGNCTSGMAP